MIATRSKASWLVPAGLIVLSIVPAIGGGIRLSQVLGDGPGTAENARFIAAPVSIVVHITGTVIFSFLGALQFSSGLRRARRGLHRAMGKVLVPTAVIVATTGLWMTLTYPWAEGDGLAVYLERLIVGVLMLIAVGKGVEAILRRDYSTHGEWMIRAYAIGLGAGTQVLTHLPWFILAEGKPAGVPRAVMMGAGWAINIVVAEWVIRRGRVSRRGMPAITSTPTLQPPDPRPA
jgi:uncharacterized membrane protein